MTYYSDNLKNLISLGLCIIPLIQSRIVYMSVRSVSNSQGLHDAEEALGVVWPRLAPFLLCAVLVFTLNNTHWFCIH